jgi:hypothetical protein
MKFHEIKIGDVFEEAPGLEKDRAKRRLSCVAGKRPSPENRHFDAEIALISLGAVRKMPDVLQWATLNASLASGDWALTTERPELPPVRALSDLDEERRVKFSAKIAANTTLIQPVLDLGWGAFDEIVRGKKITEVAGGKFDHTTHSARWIRELLKDYWRSGRNFLALGPDYSACGAPSREDRRLKALNSESDPDPEVVCPRRPGRRITIVVPGAPVADASDVHAALGRGGTAIHPSADPLILKLINRYLNKAENKSLINIRLERYKGLPWESIKKYVRTELGGFAEFRHLKPSRRQVAYIGKNSVKTLELLRSVVGDKEVNLNVRPKRGDYRDVSLFAGQRYEVDVKLSDIHLVDDVSGYPLGRVYVLFVVDRYSGMVVGVYVVTDNIDFAHCGRALHAAYSNKPEWCRQLGLEIGPDDWPCEGMPEETAADNEQFATKAAEVIPQDSSDLILCRSFRGDDKPQVEVSFYLADHGYVHLYGMGVTNGPKQRCQEDPAKKAYVSVRTFARGLINYVVRDMNHRAFPEDRWLDPNFLKTRKAPTPFNVWNWSVGKDREGGIGGPPRRYDPALMMPRLFERAVATMTEFGLKLDGIYFDLPDDKAFQVRKALAETAFSGTRDVPVHYDRLTTRQVYFIPDGSDRMPIACPLAHKSRDLADLTFDTVRIRRLYRAGLTKGAKDLHEGLSAPVQAAQMAGAKEDLKSLKANHGTFTKRNAAANSIDKDTIRENQIAAENLALTNAIHGPLQPSAPPDGENPAPASPVRPACFD